MTQVTEKLLKDSFERACPTGMDVTRVSVDTRSDTHDVVNVYVRGMVAGRLVTDKSDSITIARRLIPDTLRFDKEPSTLMRDATKMGEALVELLIEARTAVSTRDVSSLGAFLRKLDAAYGGAPIHPDWAVFVADWRARDKGEDQKQTVPSAT